RERLPDLVVEPGGADLLEHDRVGILEERDAIGRNLAEDTHREAGTGERLAGDDLLRETHLTTDAANLVLEELAQRLDELQVHRLGQAADVVVALDDLGRSLYRD